MAKRDVLIYGAGMSGLIAACNLASEGHKVLVREREPRYGGSRVFNPSLHTTPLDVNATSEYIGIDVTPAFHPVSALSIYLHDFKVEAPVFMAYHVERSSRLQSLDTLLFDKCVDAGVEFEFDRPLGKDEVEKLPPGTIIACGLNPEAYGYLGIPFKDWWAWMASGEKDFHNYAWIWLDECVNEYGYISFCNGIFYNLLFAYGQEVSKADLERYRDFMRRVEGMDHEDWEYVHGVATVTSSDNPQLMRKGLIMCGSMSGLIDPFLGFGISGALVSGKVAAIAVNDPEKAEEEFARFSRNYVKAFHFKNDVWYPLRERVDLLEGLARTVGPERSVGLLIAGLRAGRKSSAIPGFSPLSCH